MWQCVVAACVVTHLAPDPPAQDQCKLVNATEPGQCPATVGPPCPPCYSNLADDYKPGDDVAFDAKDKARLQSFMQWYLNWWDATYPPQKQAHGYNVFLGSAGRANIFLRTYLHSSPKNVTLLRTAEAYLNESLALLPRRQEKASYMYGHIGVWFLQSVLETIKGNVQSAAAYQSRVASTIANAATAIREGKAKSADGLDMTESTLDTGLAGMLYAALQLNAYAAADLVAPADIATLALHTLDVGIATGTQQQQEVLMYESFPNCFLWGPGHGTTGIMKSVFTALRLYPAQLAALRTPGTVYYKWLHSTLDYFVSIQLPDGNMPTNVAGGCHAIYGDDVDARVQWCHGAPGFINIYLEASLIYADVDPAAAQRYYVAGLATADTTWARGLLVKGTMFCHGIGGNVNMFLEAAEFLRRAGKPELAQKMLWRAKQFTLWTLDWDNVHATRLTQSDEGYSMYQGNYAIPMVYAPLAAGNVTACQPGWNLCI